MLPNSLCFWIKFSGPGLVSLLVSLYRMDNTSVRTGWTDHMEKSKLRNVTSATVPSQSLNQNKYSHRDFQKWSRWGSFSTALHKHCQWGIHKLHSFPHTPCRVTTECWKTTQHLFLSPRAHSKNNHTIIHFRPLLLKLLHNWTVHAPRWGWFMSGELAAKPSGFMPDCSLWLLLTRWINMGIDLCRDAVPFPSTWCLPSIHKTYGGKCADLVPRRASKLW